MSREATVVQLVTAGLIGRYDGRGHARDARSLDVDRRRDRRRVPSGYRAIYSYHRDEFYYLASGRRLAWGYVDNPPLTPVLYRISDALFGTSVFGLRIVPAFMHGGLVLLTAVLARELGGDVRGQIVAAIAAAVAPMLVTTGHFLGTVTPELLAWTAITLFVVRILNGGDPRLWLVVGALVGIGLFDKWTKVSW